MAFIGGLLGGLFGGLGGKVSTPGSLLTPTGAMGGMANVASKITPAIMNALPSAGMIKGTPLTGGVLGKMTSLPALTSKIPSLKQVLPVSKLNTETNTPLSSPSVNRFGQKTFMADLTKPNPPLHSSLKTPGFAGGQVGDYFNSLGQSYEQGGKGLSGFANMGTKTLTDTASLFTGTPSYNKIQSQGLKSFTPEIQGNMFRRAVTPMFMTENFLNKPHTMKDLTKGTETRLDKIIQDVKNPEIVNPSPKRIDFALKKYAQPGKGRSPIMTGAVKGFLNENPTMEEKIQFILDNF